MRNKLIINILLIVLGVAAFAIDGKAQFKEEAFTQNYNEPNDTIAHQDTTAKLFSFKQFIGGLQHKNTMKIGTMIAGSTIFIGGSQIYNKDYWKLPIVYGGIGSLAGVGGYYLHRYSKSQKTYDRFIEQKNAFEASSGLQYPFTAPEVDLRAKKTGTWLMVGAGLVYWGSLLDGAICYESERNPDPGRATVYSMLLPGLGQIYNGELFKVPIYWGCLAGAVHFLVSNNTNYVRFKRIHNEATNPDRNISSKVPISGETAKWYRDVYRRYRDYSIVATVAFYMLQVIDANVFAYMHDFQVSDDISLDVEPAVIPPNSAYAMNTNMPENGGRNSFGLRIGITF